MASEIIPYSELKSYWNIYQYVPILQLISYPFDTNKSWPTKTWEKQQKNVIDLRTLIFTYFFEIFNFWAQ